MFQVTSKEVQTVYLKIAESSYFNSSDKVFCNDTIILWFEAILPKIQRFRVLTENFILIGNQANG
jgi:hypothetical protein